MWFRRGQGIDDPCYQGVARNGPTEKANLRHGLGGSQSGVNRLESLGTGRISLDQCVVIRKREVKCRAFAVFRLNQNRPAVRLINPFPVSKPIAWPGKSPRPV